MVSREELKEHFSNMGATLTDEALARCEELCAAYSVDEEELAETWTAFSCSKNVDIDPTVEALGQMERAEFGGRRKTPVLAPPRSAPRASSSTLVVYNGSGSRADGDFEDEILRSYSATPKVKDALPKNTRNVSDQTSGSRAIFSPASFSPIVSTPATRYASRTNAGTIMCSFGSADKATWYSSTMYRPTINIVSSVPSKSSFMFDTLKERASVHEDHINYLMSILCTKAGIKEPRDVAELRTNEFECCGRLCYKMGKQFTAENMCLESLPGAYASCKLAMNVNEVPKLSLFPGQVVAVKATNPTGSELVVRDVISDASLPLSTEPIRLTGKEGPLQIVIASGPFTQADTMTYRPLEDFVEYLKKYRPHVAILIGPLVDIDHPHVKSGLLAETFESLFTKQVNNLMQSISGLHTQIVLVSSSCEAHHRPIFPTPAYTVKKNHPNLHLLGDPCILDVEGLKIAVTSVDVVKHIGNVEIVNAANNHDRLCRIAKHILLQNNFYPLYPPNEKVRIDTNLWYDYCHLPFTPHILVLPSDLRAYIKETLDCVIVNPEHLAKGAVGGSLARLEVRAGDKWDTACVAGQVIKI